MITGLLHPLCASSAAQIVPPQVHLLRGTIVQDAGVQAALLSAVDAMLTSHGQLPSPLPPAPSKVEADGLPGSMPLSAQQGPCVIPATGTHSSFQGESGICQERVRVLFAVPDNTCERPAGTVGSMHLCSAQQQGSLGTPQACLYSIA